MSRPTLLLPPIPSQRRSSYPLVSKAPSCDYAFHGILGTSQEWTIVHGVTRKWPFLGEVAVTVEPAVGFWIRSVRAGNVHVIVTPLDVGPRGRAVGGLPVLRRRQGIEIRLEYDGCVPTGREPGERLHGIVRVAGDESRWHQTAYGRRMYRYRILGEGRRV
jgi:hypothetical protein